MKNQRDFIHLPELFISYNDLKKYLKNLYNINITMENISKEEYNALLRKYDKLTGIYEDETDEKIKAELTSEIKEVESKIHKYERFDEYAQQTAQDGAPIKDDKEIATEILKQLGGMGKIRMMTGAYNFIALPNGVSFRIKNPKTNYIKIILTSMDLYDLEIGRVRGDQYTVIESQTGLYDDMLKPAIEKITGMYLSLKNGGEIDKHSNDHLPADTQEQVDAGKVTYRGLGFGNEGVKIKVHGKEYIISDEKFEELGGVKKIRFNAPFRKFKDGGPVGEIEFKKVNQFGNESLYQATDGEMIIPYSITRIKDTTGTLLRLDNSSTGVFESYSIEEVKNKIRGLFTEQVNPPIAAEGAEIKESHMFRQGIFSKQDVIQSLMDVRVVMGEDLSKAQSLLDYLVKKLKEESETNNDIDSKIIESIQKKESVLKEAINSNEPIEKIEQIIVKPWPSEILQEILNESKDQGLVLISPEYMETIKQTLSNDNSETVYQDMIWVIMAWLDDYKIILRSKEFMKKITENI